MTRQKQAIISKLHRTYGMNPAAREQQAEVYAQFDDWTARCRKCKAELKGTLAQLKEHVCGPTS